MNQWTDEELLAEKNRSRRFGYLVGAVVMFIILAIIGYFIPG